MTYIRYDQVNLKVRVNWKDVYLVYVHNYGTLTIEGRC
jgi:hypothetical protein